MGVVQIIGGGNLAKAFTELGIAAVKVYQSDKDWLGTEYQVWEMPIGEFEILEAFAHEEWQSDFGWYHTAGCNDTSEIIEFNVNGQTMLGFKNENSWYHSEDYLSELEEGEKPTLPSYKNFTFWFSEYQGLSKPENLAYFATTLAEKNGLSKAEFFEKYQGSNEAPKISAASIIAFAAPSNERQVFSNGKPFEVTPEVTLPDLSIQKTEQEASDLSKARLEPILFNLEAEEEACNLFRAIYEGAVKLAVGSLFERRIEHYEIALKYCRHSKKRAYILKKLSILKPAYEQWRKENVLDSN